MRVIFFLQIVKDNDWILINDTCLISSLCQSSIEFLQRDSGDALFSLPYNERVKLVVSHVAERNSKVHKGLAKTIAEGLLQEKHR